MAVNSISFLIFLAALCLAYYCLCPPKYRWMLLLAGSIFFYVTACAASPAYILVSAAVTWGAALLMEKNREKSRTFLVGAIAVNLGLLIFLKYGGFLAQNANRLLGLGGLRLPVPDFLVPLGISYYTLIAIGYLMDVYKNKAQAQKNFGKLLLFLGFFGQTTQGPISRYGKLGNRLFAGHAFEYRNLSYGCQRILWGFFKKLVIADRMQPMVKTIFENYEKYGAGTYVLGCIYMTVQVYADFAGYMDIVAGAAEIFGIRLEENFRRPFLSASLEEFWRRWHITLGGWFRDYLFYPLALSKQAVKFGRLGRKRFGIRVGKLFPSLFALVFVWSLTGLWHDASLKYLFWGLANGVVIMGAMLLEPWFQKGKKALHISDKSKIWHGFCVARTFLLVSALKIFPGAVSTAAIPDMVRRFFQNLSLPRGMAQCFPGLTKSQAIILLGAVVILWIVDMVEEKRDLRDVLAEKHAAVRWLWYGFLIAAILCAGNFNVAMQGGFAYAQY